MWLTGSCPASREITRPGKRLKFRLRRMVSTECLLFPYHHKTEKSWSWIGTIFTFGEGGREEGGQGSGQEEVEGTSVLNMDVLRSSSCSGWMCCGSQPHLLVSWLRANLMDEMKSHYYPTSPCLVVRLVLLRTERLVIFHMLSAFHIWVEIHCLSTPFARFSLGLSLALILNDW